MDANEYETPELLELGDAREMTQGDPSGTPDHCNCQVLEDFWLV